MHGCVGLQRRQAKVAALALEGHGVSNDGTHAKASIELTEVNVTVLAQVYVEHTVESSAGRVGVERENRGKREYG